MARKVSRSGDDVYVVIIGEGEAIRVFTDLPTLCTLMHLDLKVISRYISEKGQWTGLNLSVWRGVLESRSSHRGYF